MIVIFTPGFSKAENLRLERQASAETERPFGPETDKKVLHFDAGSKGQYWLELQRLTVTERPLEPLTEKKLFYS